MNEQGSYAYLQIERDVVGGNVCFEHTWRASDVEGAVIRKPAHKAVTMVP